MPADHPRPLFIRAQPELAVEVPVRARDRAPAGNLSRLGAAIDFIKRRPEARLCLRSELWREWRGGAKQEIQLGNLGRSVEQRAQMDGGRHQRARAWRRFE